MMSNHQISDGIYSPFESKSLLKFTPKVFPKKVIHLCAFYILVTYSAQPLGVVFQIINQWMQPLAICIAGAYSFPTCMSVIMISHNM